MWAWVAGVLGGAVGSFLKDQGAKLAGKAGKAVVGGVAAATAFETAARAIWNAALAALKAAFKVVDTFSAFSLNVKTEPVSVLWPVMLWISGALALGLFFYQIISTTMRGGRGFLRLVAGPVQYGLALALTVGMVTALLAAADGVTTAVLDYGLNTSSFQDALTHTGIGDAVSDGVKVVVLAIIGVVGVIPVAIGFSLEMLFREAGITILVITVPITAAGLLSGSTKSWYWNTCRWIIALIFMKPALAIALTIGVAMTGGAKGLSGLLVGVGVLFIALFTPLVLFKLLAFIDPHTPAGSAIREARASRGMMAGYEAAGGPDLSSSGGGAQERANHARFNSPPSTFGGDADGFDTTPADESADPGQGDQSTPDSDESQSLSASAGAEPNGAGSDDADDAAASSPPGQGWDAATSATSAADAAFSTGPHTGAESGGAPDAGSAADHSSTAAEAADTATAASPPEPAPDQPGAPGQPDDGGESAAPEPEQNPDQHEGPDEPPSPGVESGGR